MFKYRIKTKEEFESGYGKNFHFKFIPSWNIFGDMDYLFGYVFISDIDIFKTNKIVNIGKFRIGKNMLIILDTKFKYPDYKPKKMIY